MSHDNDKTSWGSGGLFGNRALGSLFLMVVCPAFCLTFWYTCQHLDGDLFRIYDLIRDEGIVAFGQKIFANPFNPYVWKRILAYMAFELFLMRFVPGKIFKASVTPTGHVPVYIANGFQSYLISIIALFALKVSGYWNPAEVYDYMGDFLSSMNLFALGLCLFLTIKGLNFPSTKDSGSNGDLIVDYFWGTELYPRVFGFDIKQFTNCRFGMMFWQIGILCYAMKQYDTLGYVTASMFVSVAVQTVYIAKFFYWETGYFCSMDIQHDRAGYYLCWGCCVWVPSMYTMHTYYLTNHPVELSLPLAAFFLFAGWYSVYVNYDCDRQRQEFRSTNAKCKVWGREPDYIVAKYITSDGEERSSLLLASGWWGLARHFHYVPEILASFFWCVPALFTHPLPFFYPVYLTILLVDRAWRDDKRCGDKYGKYWVQYCEKVPYKIVPGVI